MATSDTTTPRLIAGTPPSDLQLCNIRSVSALLDLFAQYMSLDVGTLETFAEVIASPTVPSAADRDKIWLKTSIPKAMGFYTGGDWLLFYPQPAGAWVPWDVALKPIPTGWSEASPAELAQLPTMPAGTMKWIKQTSI